MTVLNPNTSTGGSGGNTVVKETDMTDPNVQESMEDTLMPVPESKASTLIFGREPIVIMALIEAVLGMVVVFGLNLTVAESTSILVVAGAILTVVARQSVTPTAKVVAEKVKSV